ncbi:MAG: NAD(P)H-hydrate epimerase [Candidatus Competibacteraceae bacterium]|nr:NAD(P)H-hydrate epimerase [Candidatus Competibacteraceae bacterium]
MHHQSLSQLPQALYRADQVRELDRRASEDHGIAGYELMSRAGRAAFEILRQRWSRARRIIVVCGGGNNAGDGYVIARLAREAGYETEALYLKDPDQLSGDARTAWADARDEGLRVIPFGPAALDGADLIVDALGALVASVLGYFYITKSERKSYFDRLLYKFLDNNK